MSQIVVFAVSGFGYFLFGLSAVFIVTSGWSDALQDNRIDILVVICSILQQILTGIIWAGVLDIAPIGASITGGGIRVLLFLSVASTLTAVQMVWGLIKWFQHNLSQQLHQFGWISAVWTLLGLANLLWSGFLTFLIWSETLKWLRSATEHRYQRKQLRNYFADISTGEGLTVEMSAK